jgi:hypothetical protein
MVWNNPFIINFASRFSKMVVKMMIDNSSMKRGRIIKENGEIDLGF